MIRLWSVEFRSPVDGKLYVREIVSASHELAQETCDKLGAGERVVGEVVALGDLTPDGPLTQWRATEPGR